MKYFLSLFILIAFNASAQFKNIILAGEVEGKYAPVEPSISINPKDPKNIVAGIVMDRVVYTTDEGVTWEEKKLSSPAGVFGDPAVIADSRGRFFYFHLSDPSGQGRSNPAWLDRIVCQQSLDGGKTWSEGASIGNNPAADHDKPWPAVHPRKNLMCVTWTQFDKYGSDDPACHSNIQFSKSSGGEKWSKPIQINQNPGDCKDSDRTMMGAIPAIGSDGKIYVAWASNGYIYFDRSYNEGEMWLSGDLIVSPQAAGWDFEIPGINRTNGLPVLMIDNSPNKYHGVLFLIWADQKNGPDDTDIFLTRSHDRGDTWTPPKKINKDNSRTHQFLPWMTIDPTTGHIFIVYYDRRIDKGTSTDVYLSYSTDGGTNFKEVKINEISFSPDVNKFFGDYTNISAYGGIIAPIWTQMNDGKTSVYTTIIKETDLQKMK